MVKVVALMTITHGAGGGRNIQYARGEAFDIADKAEVERLMRIGAISVGGAPAPRAPAPAERDDAVSGRGGKSAA